jgi:hypothetical protein
VAAGGEQDAGSEQDDDHAGDGAGWRAPCRKAAPCWTPPIGPEPKNPGAPCARRGCGAAMTPAGGRCGAGSGGGCTAGSAGPAFGSGPMRNGACGIFGQADARP